MTHLSIVITHFDWGFFAFRCWFSLFVFRFVANSEKLCAINFMNRWQSFLSQQKKTKKICCSDCMCATILNKKEIGSFSKKPSEWESEIKDERKMNVRMTIVNFRFHWLVFSLADTNSIYGSSFVRSFVRLLLLFQFHTRRFLPIYLSLSPAPRCILEP